MGKHMITNGDFCGAFLVCVIIFVLVAVFASRAPLRAIGRLFRTVGNSTGGRAEKPGGAIPEAPEVETGSPAPAAPVFNPLPSYKTGVGKKAFSVITRVFRPETAIEQALRGGDEGFARED